MPSDYSHIKFLVLDVDGVLTDGGMYYISGGDEFKKFNTKDGHGIRMLEKVGIAVALISAGLGKSEEIVTKRAKILELSRCYVGQDPKLDVLNAWLKELNIHMADVAFMGDDMNDLPVIQEVGLSACPADAVQKVKDAVDIVLKTKGGDGCVREFIDNYLKP